MYMEKAEKCFLVQMIGLWLYTGSYHEIVCIFNSLEEKSNEVSSK
jgi:hypothetical protein